uniref:Pectinesterase n=1 Tax=Oryza punctata TaxID=4537 RepID=A0A0E0JG24_ORYPU
MAHATLGSPEPAKPRLRCADGGHRRRLLVVLCIVGLALAVGVAVSVAIAVLGRSRMTSSGGGRAPRGRAPTEAIARTCGVTLYPELCVSTLMGFPGAVGAGDAELVPMSLNATHRCVVDALFNATALGGAAALLPGARSSAAYGDCVELLDAAAELLARSVGAIAAPPPSPDSVDDDTAGRDDDDVMTWLSAALTSHDTCQDSLQEVGVGGDDDDDSHIKPQMLDYLGNLGEHLSNSLAIFAARGRPGGELSDVPGHSQLHRRLLTSDDHNDVSFPRWVRDNDRRLLQAATAAEIEPDMVVAKDGTGTHRKIRDAIKAAPEHSRRRVVIYIKAGVYIENVKIGRRKTNLMLVGDGAGKTVVVGYRSVHDNYTTFHTATLAVAGAGFIMRDMTVENRAGAARHQAVALLVSGDHAVVYRSAVLGYQDTLYAHAQRQFYRDCDVAGTVDFVFGNAAVVLQNCTLWARRPLPGQKNTVTAQGRRDPNQSTGISVHGCRLLPSPELELAPAARRDHPTYLGRPWKPYSRAVYMMSYMADHVHAAGWLAWDASGRAPDTLYYGEYRNSGPGAAVGGRVSWPGHRVIKLPEEAMEFTVGRFIGGYSWLPPTGVAFVAGLTV